MLDGGAFKSINESESLIIISLMSALSCISGGMRFERCWRKIRSVCLSLNDRITLDYTDEGDIRQIGVLVQVNSEWIPGLHLGTGLICRAGRPGLINRARRAILKGKNQSLRRITMTISINSKRTPPPPPERLITD